jgi:hypothetical protein
MSPNPAPPPKHPGTLWHLLGSVALLVAIGWAGLRQDADQTRAWVIVLVLMTAFAVLNGHGITGVWRGILIDHRNRMSLSRLQILAWTLIVLSALVTSILTNVRLGADAPLEVIVPQPLWILMGISAAAAFGAPALLGNKRSKEADPEEWRRTAHTLMEQGNAAPLAEDPSIVLRNRTVRDARWSELLKGDESGNAAAVDLGKLQMFLFTFVLACGYAAALYAMFQGDEIVTALPAVEDGMNVLLGISQTGYLASKTANVSKAQPGGYRSSE